MLAREKMYSQFNNMFYIALYNLSKRKKSKSLSIGQSVYIFSVIFLSVRPSSGFSNFSPSFFFYSLKEKKDRRNFGMFGELAPLNSPENGYSCRHLTSKKGGDEREGRERKRERTSCSFV